MRCSLSLISKLLKHILNNIGLNWQSIIDKLNCLHFCNIANTDFMALLIRSFLTFMNDSDLLNTSPKYMTSVTVSFLIVLT